MLLQTDSWRATPGHGSADPPHNSFYSRLYNPRLD